MNAFPRTVLNDFLIDVEELTDIKAGLQRQREVVDRIVWGYQKWF
jgi:nuclear control of ATPase protein 2